MIKYHRVAIMEREEISRYLMTGCSIRSIANVLQRSPSTISREIRRYDITDRRYYRAVFAQQHCNKMRHKLRKSRKLAKNTALRDLVLKYLRKKWSPEQIARKLWLMYPDNADMHISHETIYSYLYVLPKGTFRKQLISQLRRNHKYRQKRAKDSQSRGSIQDFLSIEKRPQEVADRIVPGHWEGDLMIGRRNASAIGTLVERTTRMTFIVKLNNQDAITVRKAFAEQFKEIPKGLKKTLTYDKGAEMAQHKLFRKDTDIQVYFAHPTSPWERGTNENTNGLLRQYFPKGTDFSKISEKRLKYVQDELNDRPRKTLDWYSPHEKFIQLLQ
jgi:IS30 family transposase